MFAQLIITVLIISLFIWLGIKFLYKPYIKSVKLQEIDIEKLKAKKKKLQEMKEELQSTKEEIDVTTEMNRVEKELRECEKDLNRLEKKREKRKKT